MSPKPERHWLAGARDQPVSRGLPMASIIGPVDDQSLASRLQKACYLEGRFLLRSGRTANFYFDKYMFESDPSLLREVAERAATLVPDGTELLAGLELGGVPISTALSLFTGIPQVLVRKKAKEHGTAKLAEGPDVAGRQLLIVEDVVTTGGQVVLSAEELRQRGASVSSVLCVIDRRSKVVAPKEALGHQNKVGSQEQASGSGTATTEPDKLAAAGLGLISLFTADELTATASSAGGL